MTQDLASRIHHTGTLANMTSSRINIPQSRLTTTNDPYRLAPGIKTGVRYSPSQKNNLKKLLSSPHRAKVLRMNGITMDDRFVAPLKRSTTRGSFKGTSSRTPISQGTLIAQHHAAASQISLSETCSIPIRNKSSPLDKALPPKPILCQEDSPKRHDLFDAKDTSSKMLNDSYPPLQPGAAKPASTSSDSPPSDSGSFEVTPSLCSISDNAFAEFEIGVAKNIDVDNICEQSAHSITTSRSTNYSLSAPRLAECRVASLSHVAIHKDGSPMQRKKANPHDVRGRDTLSNKVNSRVDETTIKVVEKDLPQVPKDFTSKEGLTGGGGRIESLGITGAPFLEGTLSGCAESPKSEKYDTPLRRSHKFGVGPTVRFSKDAHEVIMGSGPPMRKTSSCPKGSKVNTNQNPRDLKIQLAGASGKEADLGKHISSSSNVNANHTVDCSQPKSLNHDSIEIFCQVDIKQTVSPFAARTFSLPGSPTYHPFPQHHSPTMPQSSFAARLSRPTKASQARATESKTYLLSRGKKSPTTSGPSLNKSSPSTPLIKTAGASTTAVPPRKSAGTTSVKKVTKGFKSRFSAMLASRHRNAQARVDVPNSYKPIISEESISEESIIDNDPLAIHANRQSASHNLTAYENSEMDRNPMEAVRSYPSGDIFEGEPVEGMAPQRDEGQRRADERYASEAHIGTSYGRYVSNNPHLIRGGHRPGDEEGPPTSPRSREGPPGHYTENEQQNQAGEDQYDENGVGLYLDQLLENAETHFRAVVTASQSTTHPASREAIRRILEPLGVAIQATRAARISAISLTNANAELARYTAELSGIANQAAGVAVSTSIRAPAPDN